MLFCKNINKNAHLTEKLSSVSVILKEQFVLINNYYMRVHDTHSRLAPLIFKLVPRCLKVFVQLINRNNPNFVFTSKLSFISASLY